MKVVSFVGAAATVLAGPVGLPAQASDTGSVVVHFCRPDSVVVRVTNVNPEDRAIERVIRRVAESARVVPVIRPRSSMKHLPTLLVIVAGFSKAEAVWLKPGAQATAASGAGFAGTWDNPIDGEAVPGLVQGALENAFNRPPPWLSCQ